MPRNTHFIHFTCIVLKKKIENEKKPSIVGRITFNHLNIVESYVKCSMILKTFQFQSLEREKQQGTLIHHCYHVTSYFLPLSLRGQNGGTEEVGQRMMVLHLFMTRLSTTGKTSDSSFDRAINFSLAMVKEWMDGLPTCTFQRTSYLKSDLCKSLTLVHLGFMTLKQKMSRRTRGFGPNIWGFRSRSSVSSVSLPLLLGLM